MNVGTENYWNKWQSSLPDAELLETRIEGRSLIASEVRALARDAFAAGFEAAPRLLVPRAIGILERCERELEDAVLQITVCEEVLRLHRPDSGNWNYERSGYHADRMRAAVALIKAVRRQFADLGQARR